MVDSTDEGHSTQDELVDMAEAVTLAVQNTQPTDGDTLEVDDAVWRLNNMA